MSSRPLLDALPEEYLVQRDGKAVAAAHERAWPGLRAAGFGPSSDGALLVSQHLGRRPLQEIHAAGERLLLRRFHHGGLLRWLTGERFLDAQRPFRELALSHRLRQSGVRTPEVVAARARPGRGFGWRLDVLTRHVPGSLDLGWVLAAAERGEIERGSRRRLVHALGAFLRRLHAQGFLHADLNPANVLVEESALRGGEPRFWILDLDRSRFRPALSDLERQQNLRRLYRHVERRERERGRALSRTDFARFFRGYDPTSERWKADWRAVAGRHARRARWHALGWVLERRLGTRDSRLGPAPVDAASAARSHPRNT